jgi:hypothetical protein
MYNSQPVFAAAAEGYILSPGSARGVLTIVKTLVITGIRDTRIFGLEIADVTGGAESCIMSFIIFTLY